jgi:hypothetical protein
MITLKDEDMIELPPLGGRVRFQFADDLAWCFLDRHGFTYEHLDPGGKCIARRDFYRLGPAVLPQEPPPPRFPIHII